MRVLGFLVSLLLSASFLTTWGQTWKVSRASSFPLNAVVSGDFGFVAGGGPSASLLKSLRGDSWEEIPLGGAPRSIRGIATATNTGGRVFLAVDASGGILRSTSASGPWQQVAQARAGLHQVAGRDNLFIACGEEGLVLETVDAGVTWKEVASPAAGKSFRHLRCKGLAPEDSATLAEFLMLSADGGAWCRVQSGKWLPLAPLTAKVPITSLRVLGADFWVFGQEDPVSWSGRFIGTDTPVALWVAHILPFLQTSAKYRAVAGLDGSLHAFGDSGLIRSDAAGRFPGLESIWVPDVAVGNFTDATSTGSDLVAVTDAGFAVRMVSTNVVQLPEVTVQVLPGRQRVFEGDALTLDLRITPSALKVKSVQWKNNGRPVAQLDSRVPSSATWLHRTQVTSVDAGTYDVEVQFVEPVGKVVVIPAVVEVQAQSPIQWTARTTTPAFSNILSGIAFPDATVVLGGQSGLMVSTNGLTWSQVPGFTTNVYWLERLDGVCFALGEGLIARSENGRDWARGRGSLGSMVLYGVVRWNGQWVVFGSEGEKGVGAVSSDGIDWNLDGRMASDDYWYAGATDGQVLLLGGRAGALRCIQRDGTIRSVTVPTGGDDIYSLVFFRGIFFALTPGGMVLSSPDGIVWSQRQQLGFDGYVFRISGGCLFVVGSGERGGVACTHDGNVWNKGQWVGVTPPSGFTDVFLRDGVFHLVGSQGVVGVSSPVAAIEVPTPLVPQVRQPADGLGIGRIEVPVLGSERMEFQWWVDGIPVTGALGQFVEIPASGLTRSVWVWALIRWSGGAIPVGPFRVDPLPAFAPSLKLNTQDGVLPPGSDLVVSVGGISSVGQVRIRVSIDLNSDGVRQPNEPVVESFLVTDGVVPQCGGVRNPHRPGDEDGIANGSVSCRIPWSLPTEFEALPLPYVVECEFPGHPETSSSAAFRILPRVQEQGVEGVVHDVTSGLPVASTVVVALQPEGLQPVAAALTDGAGRYRLHCPPGGFWILPLKTGYVSPIDPMPILEGEQCGDCLVLPGCVAKHNLSLVVTNATLSGKIRAAAPMEMPEEELILAIGESGIALAQVGLDWNWHASVVGGLWFAYTPVLGSARMGRMTLGEGAGQLEPFSVASGARLTNADLLFQRPSRMLRVSVKGAGNATLPGSLVFALPKSLGAQPLVDPPWVSWAKSDAGGTAWLALSEREFRVGGLLVDGSRVHGATNDLVVVASSETQLGLLLAPAPRSATLLRFLEIDRGCCDWPRMVFGSAFDLEWEIEASQDLANWKVIASGTTSGHVGSLVDGDSVGRDIRFYRVRRRNPPETRPMQESLWIPRVPGVPR